MKEKKELNLDTFNEILFNAFKDEAKTDETYLELLQIELQTAYGMKIQKMEELVDALNEERPYHNILKSVNTIDSNCNHLVKKIAAQRVKMGLPEEDDD